MKDFSAELAVAARAGKIKRDLLCEQIIDQLIRSSEQPGWSVPEGDVNGVYAFTADSYWRRRFSELPSVLTGIKCARWLQEHTAPGDDLALAERWAAGFGFLNRDTLDTDVELNLAHKELTKTPNQPLAAYFCFIYHGAKLRANFNGPLLMAFLQEFPPAHLIQQYRDRPLPTALSVFAALRVGADDNAKALIEKLWQHSGNTASTAEMCLHGMVMAANVDRHLPSLLSYAKNAVNRWPEAHLLHYRLAMALRLSGDFVNATQTIDRALELLPAIGQQVSHREFQERYLQERLGIEQAHQTYRMVERLINDVVAERLAG